ncbi:hypothetical protein P691DRAFT_790041 [Macrolepiota fuliginosa MF-IS2]|uniref:Uncharacterized protein n=1 Tax=Macrolepiota fuliginosa MF-IS2 TaxID=1400762 RepID=A0A9P5XFZ0_9AGAR|nr:hypothetical protein P691DRAFT_790041 [Macrolepiota fuliginosa MF-IS2]
MFKKLLITTLALAVTTVMALPSVPSVFNRQTGDLATCDYVFVPGVPVDPATTNLLAEFNFITGHSLAVGAPSGAIDGTGSTFTENPNDSFNVHNELSAQGWTCAQTKEFLEGLARSTQLGPSGISWLIQSVACTCAT